MVEDGRVTTPRDPDIAFAREKAKRSLPISILTLLGLIAMYLPLPQRFIAFLPLVVAVGLSGRLIRFLRGRSGREKVWPAITLGLVGYLIAALTTQIVLYGPIASYETCIDQAQTAQASAACELEREKGPLGGAGFVLR